MKNSENSIQVLVSLICRAVALAMGVAVFVLNSMHALTLDTVTAALSLGLALLAIASLPTPSKARQDGSQK